MRKHALIASLLLCVSAVAQAAPYYCMTTHKFVNIGDTLEMVKTACGAPESETATNLADVQSQPVAQWFYTQSATVAGRNIGGPAQIMLFFVNGKVSQIQVNNQQFDSLNFCGQGLGNSPSSGVKVGDTQDSVVAQCGNPASQNAGTQKVTGPTQNGVILIYNNGQYVPKTTMSFMDGKLASIKVGP